MDDLQHVDDDHTDHHGRALVNHDSAREDSFDDDFDYYGVSRDDYSPRDACTRVQFTLRRNAYAYFYFGVVIPYSQYKVRETAWLILGR